MNSEIEIKCNELCLQFQLYSLEQATGYYITNRRVGNDGPRSKCIHTVRYILLLIISFTQLSPAIEWSKKDTVK